MEVSVNEGSGLQRQVTVTVPAERVNQELDQRLRQLAKQVSMPGFRPGKVPLSVVEGKYRDQVHSEVIQELVSETYPQALEDNELNPVAQPEVEPGALERDGDFAYTAHVEIYPAIEPQGYKGMALTRRTAEVGEADVDETIERLRHMRATWEPVERAAAEGDQVLIDFRGTIDGEPFDGGEASDYTMEIGAGRHLEAMEQGLIGAGSGETRGVDVPFPEDYPRDELAGRTVHFEVTVKDVREKQLPAMDADFLASFGVEDGELETLRADVREGLETETQERSQQDLRGQIFDQLAESNPMDLPESLVKQQIDRLVESQKQQYRDQGIDPDSLDLESTGVREQVRPTAERQVTVGLLIPEIAKVEAIEVTDDEVRAELEQAAEQYGSQRDQFLQYVLQNPQQYQEFEGRALETKVIQWIEDHAEITEEAVSVGHLLGWEDTGEEAA